MLSLFILLAMICLLWMFAVSVHAQALEHLGSGRCMDSILQIKQRFYYQYLHRAFLKDPSFDSYLHAARLSLALCYLVLGALGLFLIFHYPTTTTFYVVSSLAFVLSALLCGELLPYFYVKKAAHQAFFSLMPLASFFLILSFPLAYLYLKSIDLYFKKIESRDEDNLIDSMKETILHILLDANVKGKLATADKNLIRSVIKFKDRIVKEVMVPRIDLFSLPLETTIEQAARHFLQEGYSRIPVYQGSVDNIVGVLMFKDFLNLYMEAFEQKKDVSFANTAVTSLMKNVLYTPETKRVSQLLQEFRSKQTHLAIVVDEYGGTEGVVTIEDLLEEIVGDIADEYDEQEQTLYTTAADGEGWIVDAHMNLLDAEEAFSIRFPHKGDYETLAGYVFHQVGSIPKNGLVLHHADFNLEILSTTDRSVEKVKITPLKKA